MSSNCACTDNVPCVYHGGISDDTTSLHERLPTTKPMADDLMAVESIRAEAASLKGCLGGCYSTPAHPREGYCAACYIAKLRGENARLREALRCAFETGTCADCIARAALSEGEGA